MHKDQKRVKDVLLPQIMDRVLSDSQEAERDCTVLNRALIQGPDPLYLMETCPEQFKLLCKHLFLDVEVGKDAIVKAHWQGPGVLLDGTGLPTDWKDPVTKERIYGADDFKVEWRREALWLILVSFSDCTESGYGPETTILERLQRATRAATNFESALKMYWISALRGFDGRSADDRSAFGDAIDSAKKFAETTAFTFDERGFPHTSADVGFYVAYKQGHKVCAVSAGDKVFWGTTPDTTLAEQRLTVDVELSPSFGFVRN